MFIVLWWLTPVHPYTSSLFEPSVRDNPHEKGLLIGHTQPHTLNSNNSPPPAHVHLLVVPNLRQFQRLFAPQTDS